MICITYAECLDQCNAPNTNHIPSDQAEDFRSAEAPRLSPSCVWKPGQDLTRSGVVWGNKRHREKIAA